MMLSIKDIRFNDIYYGRDYVMNHDLLIAVLNLLFDEVMVEETDNEQFIFVRLFDERLNKVIGLLATENRTAIIKKLTAPLHILINLYDRDELRGHWHREGSVFTYFQVAVEDDEKIYLEAFIDTWTSVDYTDELIYLLSYHKKVQHYQISQKGEKNGTSS